jgi:glycosyltransferase involved in cell wall biosynthesis
MRRLPGGGNALPPHILMIVGNDIHTDSRVRREALGLASAGFEVTVLGYSSGDRREETWLGPCRLIRVPVEWTLRDHRLRRRVVRRGRRPPLLRVDAPGTKAMQRRLTLRGRAFNAETGRALYALDASSHAVPARVRFKATVAFRRVRMALLRIRRWVFRLRTRCRRDTDRLFSRSWRWWDAWLSRRTAFARWERTVCEIGDYEAVFGPVIDELAPDVIHAHDVHMVGIAADAAARARLAGRDVRWIYDAHEFVAGLSQYGGRTRRVVAAWADLERTYIGRADRVITVSPAIAAELRRRHRLPRLPTVVLNAPAAPRDGPAHADRGGDRAVPSVRAAAGLDQDVPFIVYSGGVQSARGLDSVVEALVQLPEVHLGIVAVPAVVTSYLDGLLERARQLGVAERVHLLPPVPSDRVVPYLASADVGIVPLLHFGSHDLALPNKLFEHLLGHTPVVVSDCRVMADFVGDLGVGEVFPAGDATALASAVRRVVDARDQYEQAIADAWPGALMKCTWDHQEQVLRELYRDLLADYPWVATGGRSWSTPPAERPRRLAIGPANMAGQARAWADAVERAYPQVTTEVVAVQRAALNFAADVSVSAQTFARDRSWQREFAEHALSSWTHVLLEACRPIMGTRHGPDFRGDVAVFHRAGIAVGLVFHGSEIRDPRRHAQAYPWSPFRDAGSDLAARLQRQRDELADQVAAFEGVKLVSTPDLLDDVPGSVWLPVVVDTAVWRPGPPPLHRELPVVVHAPSNTVLKGTSDVEATLAPLVGAGRIVYRRLENVPPEGMRDAVTDADIVLDQFALGSYGVLACEAMAAGRLTVGHVHERNRERLPADVPILEATPDTLEKVMDEVLADRAAAAARAARGPRFVARFHDGSYAARVLAPFLGLD